MNGASARPDVELRMLEALVDCAHVLGLAFGEAACGERDLDRRLALDAAFHRGFHAVRMGIRLSMTLRAGCAPAPRPAQDAALSDIEPPERPERPDREPVQTAPRRPRDGEQDRDRDDEPVSLARFLASLRGLTADAHRLPPCADAAALPELETLLAEVTAPSTAVGPRLRPPPSPAKSRFLGSAALVTNPSLAHSRESGDPGFFR